ncbi:DNA photolyase, partial [Lipomyces starkeyi]
MSYKIASTLCTQPPLPTRIIQLREKSGARHLFCNIEYEVDELRQEALLVRRCADEAGIDFMAVHDACVVQPGELATKQGKPYAVFTPWYKSWLAHIRNTSTIIQRRIIIQREQNSRTFSLPNAPAS